MMLKQFFVFFLLFTSISLGFGAQVEIKSDIYKEYSLFTYKFYFSYEENYKSFSFERPADSKLDYSIDDLGNTIKTSSAGDYYIIQPEEDTSNRTFEIRFISKEVSENIVVKNSYSQYANFNFPVDKLTYTLTLENSFGKIEEFYPRTYEQIKENTYRWSIGKVESDALFLINFEKQDETTSQNKFGSILYWIGWTILIALLLLLLILIYVLFIRKRITKEDTETKNKIKNNSSALQQEEEKVDGEKFEEIISKYLTENEKEVVEVVRDFPGIPQYDILNHLPNMTKSNLSKIISKLNSRRILNRIRVGKVNKIYLGEKLEKGEEKSQKSNK